MKKLLCITLVLALALSLSVTAFADTTIVPDPGNDYQPTPESGKTDVIYKVDPTYTVTIPGEVTIDGAAVTVKAEGVKVDNGKQVVVTLSETSEEDNTFKVKTKENASLTYTVKSGETTFSLNDAVLTCPSGLNNETDEQGKLTGASTRSIELTFALAETVQFAGEYSGTVTFDVSLEDISTTP